MSQHSIPEIVTYLRSLDAVRERSQQVFDLGLKGQLDHWDWHQDKFGDVVDYCAGMIERDFGTDYDKIPPHCRRNHFTTGSINRISQVLSNPSFPPTDQPLERAKSLIDLYIVSVLLDAGAGNAWSYTEREEGGGDVIWKGGRSEGLAVASYRMFLDGVFSSSADDKLRVDAQGLKALTPEIMARHLQVTDQNPMVGLEGRCNLLIKLGDALLARPDICPTARPGDLIAYFEPQLLNSPDGPPTLSLKSFWSTLLNLLLPIWPSRTLLPSHPDYLLGDVWQSPSLSRSLDGKERAEGDDYVPFHKLSQWLCYSLVEGIESQTGWRVDRGKGQTGLPEYRNGGLLVDIDVLTIRPESLPEAAYPKGKEQPPSLDPWHPAIIEWRAMTVIALDKIHQGILVKLGLSEKELSLAQVLEAATWKGGREIAAKKRAGGGPPIEIISDGTVF